MSSARSRNSILAARDRRQTLIDRHLRAGHATLLTLSLNIPGSDKNRPGSAFLFQETLAALGGRFPELAILAQDSDAVGPWALLRLDLDPDEVKTGCIELEEAGPVARLVDIDVYDGNGNQIDRSRRGLGPRSCLLCDQPAVECIRLKRHSYDELSGKIDELLRHYRVR